MGCGKSKHDVVAGNTVSLSKRSNTDESKEIQREADTAPEAANTAAEVANTDGTTLSTQKEGKSETNTGSGGENVGDVADVGDVTQETKVRAEGEKDGEAVPNDSSSTKEVDSSANVPLAESAAQENVVKEKKEGADDGPDIVKEENSGKELESAQTVDESKATNAEGAEANAAASDGKKN